MSCRYTLQDWNRFKSNMGIINYRAAHLIDSETGKEVLWDILHMSSKIKNDMKLTNGDHDFSYAIDPTIYLAAQLKFVKDKDTLELLWNFYRYDECDYNAKIYGTKIIDFCNEHGVSYILAIYYLSRDNGGFAENDFYDIPIGCLYKQGHKMCWAKLSSNNTLYYVEPEEEIYSKQTPEERLKFYRSIEG